ncbi:CDP-alcohol phosphatidyltransferase family protein [Gammaproteobacteria bacterium]|nr:CDP-alcohol phosphatidyltransferase family protein [Gammaproteobacteria bacterium]
MKQYFIFIPNLLSIVRIGLIYPILNSVYVGEYLVSLIYFLAASLTDALDGFLARKMNWFTELGKILDPIADKLLVIGTIFVLWANNFIPLYVFTILIGRDVLILLGAAMHMSLITNDAPSPNILGKITTGSQIFYIAQILILQATNFNLHLFWLDWIIVLITASSLLVYAFDWVKSIKGHHEQS